MESHLCVQKRPRVSVRVFAVEEREDEEYLQLVESFEKLVDEVSTPRPPRTRVTSVFGDGTVQGQRRGRRVCGGFRPLPVAVPLVIPDPLSPRPRGPTQGRMEELETVSRTRHLLKPVEVAYTDGYCSPESGTGRGRKQTEMPKSRSE